MSETADRTEKPTPKRLRDAQKKGDVARSQALSAAAAAACAFAVCAGSVASFRGKFAGALDAVFRQDRGVDPIGAAGAIIDVFGADLALFVAAPAAAAVAAILLQIGFVFAPERLTPDTERFNPGRFFSRVFGGENVSSTLIAFAGNVAVSAAALWILCTAAIACAAVFRSRTAPLDAGLVFLRPAAWKVLCAAAAFGFLDFAWRKYGHHKNLMMTREEVRQEYKETEGDPLIKSRRRRLHRQLALAALKQGVRTAKVLLVNPTHLAVALRYEGGDEAPVVAYKGEDGVAREMRREAEAAGVPIVRDVPLARSIYFSVEVEEEIPPELYQAVADILNAAARAAMHGESTTSEGRPSGAGATSTLNPNSGPRNATG
ncbi:MAG: EscU/YscU/HrcU family type III secretion system export apparatus switch protein [Deltaproteobacteria bacterium]|nr:EscU/YscU/HrcU family type III secretion system export apparatus switch protein [Deltaproteobacteria bacterium]